MAQCGEKGKCDTLMMTLEAVKTGIATIKSSMAASNSQTKSGNGSRQKPACPKCEVNEKEECTNCYVCGSEEHYTRGCKQRWGNGRGLLRRDRM